MDKKIFNRLKDSGKGIAGLFSRSIPSIYRQDLAVKRIIYKWLLIGLLIRLFFMPIALHTDLLYVYGRSSLIAYKEIIYWGGQILIHYIHAFFLLIFKPLMPYFIEVFDYQPAQIISWRLFNDFVTHPHVFRTLFLFKVPYLIFDLGCAFLFLWILKDYKKGLGAFKFWMINPVVIFATYIFSRYEAIAIFFILLSLYYARKSFFKRSLLCLGIGAATRIYPIIMLPFFIIILGRNIWQRLKLAFWGFLPLGIVTLLARLFQQTGELEKLAKVPHADFFLAMQFPLRFLYDRIYVFVVIYIVLFLYTYFNTNHSFKNLWKSILVLLLAFFATCFFHPQYFMWLIPFLALEVVEDRKFVGLFAIQVIFFIVYTFQWKQWLAGYLFMPIDAFYFASLRSPFQIINQYYPADKFIGIFRSMFTGISLWMGYLVFKQFYERKMRRR